MTDAPPPPTTVEEYEVWFVSRGVPHLIEDYSAATDIWTRAVPVLGVAYLAGGLNALDIRRSLGWNLAVAALVLFVLGAVWAIAARARHRPLRSLPRRVGPAELAVFVIGPVLPPLIVRQWGDAVQSLLEGLAVLAAIYLATSYALIPLARWGIRGSLAQVQLFLNTIVRVLPLLLLVITFLFVNAEVWQLAGRLRGWAYWVVVAVFVAMGVLFLATRLPKVVDDAVAGSGDSPPLRRRERANLMLLAGFGPALQITLVTAVVFGFFVGFGVLAVPIDTTAAWTGGEAHRLLGGSDHVVTEELLRVSGFLAAFTGMYFTVVLSTDASYREEFADDLEPELRRLLDARCSYHRLLARPSH